MKSIKRYLWIQAVICIVFMIFLLNLNAAENEYNEVIGIWSGKINFPGFKYSIALIIFQNDGYEAEIVFPDQADTHHPVDIEVNLPDIMVSSEKMQLRFIGTLKKGIISGNWVQMKRQMPLVLQKIEKISLPHRPQTPLPPFPYQIKEVTFGHSDAILSGTLTIPDNINDYSAVILISGVGTHDRDNTIFNHKPFWVIADYLTRNGMAVLRFDERGGGNSTGDRSQATTADFALDVSAGVNFLHDEGVVRVGLWGHSEGGTIASIVAAENHSVSFIILMGTPGLKGDEYNYQFEASMSKAMGASKIEIERKLELQKAIITLLSGDITDEKAKSEISLLYHEFDSSLTDEQLLPAINRFLSPWFRFNISYEPELILKNVTCPVLAIFGEKDIQVPAERNLEALESALKNAVNADYEIVILPGLNHYMQSAITGKTDEYGEITETISPLLLEKVFSWLRERNY